VVTVLGIQRTGPQECTRVLAALREAEQQHLVLTDHQLFASLSEELSTWIIQQSLRLLERVGLLTRSTSRTVITNTHLWVEHRVTLTISGRAVAESPVLRIRRAAAGPDSWLAMAASNVQAARAERFEPGVWFSAAVEDYVRTIYTLTSGENTTASTNDLADHLGLTAGSVSSMVKRLHEIGLVEHMPYHGVRLTLEGVQLALTVIRRHRLLEVFLTATLDVPWEDVERYADALEHAFADELIELIARKLDNPTIDPHGDPIPSRELDIDEQETQTLASMQPGKRATLVRVSDANPAMLSYLTEQGISIGDRIALIAR
jgi:DtxR family Mn-dependent transcriptional regulator